MPFEEFRVPAYQIFEKCPQHPFLNKESVTRFFASGFFHQEFRGKLFKKIKFEDENLVTLTL
jgi:hypothetical protein